MSYKILESSKYAKHIKKLADKHRSLKKDLSKLYDELEENPHQGILIKENTYKIRLAISSKGRGKSGGARVITYVIDENEVILLVDIYDKSEQDNKEINEIVEDFLDDLKDD
jgi:mRNA-degrading endonuclease RelE of RelBE toxin-antitoxin system